ncbi:MAG: nucleoside phosphorylase [Bacteroidota bacterium]
MSNNFSGAIAPSELIVTNKGTIYHLDLAPEQLANTVITVGDPDRVGSVSKHFDRITHRAQHREFVTHTGYIGSKQLSVVSTGIGPDNIDIVFNELDALVNIDFATRKVKPETRSLNIIRLGTCGGLQPDVPADSFVVSSYAVGLDNLLHYYIAENDADEAGLLQAFAAQTPFANAGIRPYITRSSDALRSHFTDGFVHGVTATCPGFYAPQGRMLRKPIAFPGLPETLAAFSHGQHRIVNFEMETSAIYGLGKLLGHEYLSISTVVANRSNKTFSTDAVGAVDRMIRKSLEIISGLQ